MSDFRTTYGTQGLLGILVKIYVHTRWKEVFFLNTPKIFLSCINSPRWTVSGDVCGGLSRQRRKKMNARERYDQNTTRITYAPAESCIQFLSLVMPISMTALKWLVRNIPNRNTIENSTEELVRQHNFFHLLTRMFGSYEPFALCCAPFFELCDHDGINTTLGREVGQLVT